MTEVISALITTCLVFSTPCFLKKRKARTSTLLLSSQQNILNKEKLFYMILTTKQCRHRHLVSKNFLRPKFSVPLMTLPYQYSNHTPRAKIYFFKIYYTATFSSLLHLLRKCSKSTIVLSTINSSFYLLLLITRMKLDTY